ncbi:mitochondrial ribosomal protein L21 precursor, putative [Plasmodium relictum]|uniref:Large ribosomal subunit protein bL21m n=1 Tax=Plasmodium relictum TaxID=85471 RepID=A0A1J1HHH7_PLARL|nr:mitochondrial ribosomal protein L21 precursor, putative [Plasmodium relictum]CRH03922.1 mitochondrial ribosomal protein L21 precursor, putative [Plasmodium relictum]
MLGKHRKRRINPPLFPVHPNEEKKKNLNNFITYKDLKIRWRNTSKNYRKKVTIARKWKNLHCLLPSNKNSCIFILHKNLPFTRFKKNNSNIEKDNVDISFKNKTTEEQVTLNNSSNLFNHNNKNSKEPEHYNNKICEDKQSNSSLKLAKSDNENLTSRNSVNYEIKENNRNMGRRKINNILRLEKQRKTVENNSNLYNHQEIDTIKQNYYEKPPNNLKYLLNNDKKEMFCIFKSNFINEHKVTIGDIVQTEKLHRKKAGDIVYFGTVLFVGTKNFSIIGKPTVPYCKVKAVIEQITLSKEILSFRYKKVRRSSRFLRIKHWITILKIEDIIINLENEIKDERIKPLQILDLWSNRWLYQKELNFIKFDENKRPLAEQIFNLIEHQPNTLHRRGLTECYRFYPDPYIPQTY